MSFVNESFQENFNINFMRNIKSSLKSQFFFSFHVKKVSKIGLLTNGLIASISIYQKIKWRNFQQTYILSYCSQISKRFHNKGDKPIF